MSASTQVRRVPGGSATQAGVAEPTEASGLAAALGAATTPVPEALRFAARRDEPDPAADLDPPSHGTGGALKPHDPRRRHR